MATNRKNYGVYTNTLGNVAKTLAPRVTEVLNQLTTRGYKNLEDQAEHEYETALQYETMYGRKPGAKSPSVRGKRFHLLCSVTGAMFMTYQYQHVDGDVRVCLEHGTPVWVFSPYKEQDMVRVHYTAKWQELMAEEAAANKKFYATVEYATWQKECIIQLTAVLNTQIPWIKEGYRLHTLMRDRCNNNLDIFLTYCQGVIATLEDKGEWDIDLTESMVMNEKASSASYIATKGINKGQRTFWCKDDPEQVAYWYNYEVLPVDILTKFVHLTYLDSIGYKPLKRVYTDGVAMSGKELWFGSAIEDMVRTTPLYVDPNMTHEKQQREYPDELLTVVQFMGIDTIKKLGYKEAKASILYNLKNK